MTDVYCSGLRCGRKNICALWTHHLTPPLPRPLNVAQYADHAGVCHKFELRVVNVGASAIPVGQTFPEDDLPLLAPDIRTQTPTSFALHVSSLVPALRVKAAKTKVPKLVGKTQTKASKKNDGIYLIEIRALETKYELRHNAKKEFPQTFFAEALASLGCTTLQLTEFLRIKKFTPI